MSDKKKALGRDPLAWIQATGKLQPPKKEQPAETPAPPDEEKAAEPAPQTAAPPQEVEPPAAPDAPAPPPRPAEPPTQAPEHATAQRPPQTVVRAAPGLPPILAPSPATAQSRPLTNWPFVLIITLDMLILVLLGYFAYLDVRQRVNAAATDVSNMQNSLSSLQRRVEQLESPRPPDKGDSDTGKSRPDTGKGKTGKISPK
jgi:hypothetical protein